jgi:hypothetical protein
MKQRTLWGIPILLLLLAVLYVYTPIPLFSAVTEAQIAPVQVEEQQAELTTAPSDTVDFALPTSIPASPAFTEKQLDPKFDWSKVDLSNISYG